MSSECEEPGHPHDKQVLLVIRLRSGADGYTRVPPQLAMPAAERSMMEIVRQRQARGEIPAGEIASVLQVR
jgi:hypothetical protein